MRRRTLLRFVGFSLIAALLLSVVSFLALHELTDLSSRPHRQAFALALASEIEMLPYAQSMQTYNANHQGPRGVRTQLWVVDAKGTVLATNTEEPLPEGTAGLDQPDAIHDFTSKTAWFSRAAELGSVRLQAPTPTFLVYRVGGRRPAGRALLAPLALTFILVGAAVFVALSLTFYYLQGKSREAKQVLSRLEAGDLKARFRIQRIDEVGNLMLDFNRMASEIERLVRRVQDTERARRLLLQELSHDLRTPLTSLTTSVETLQAHFEEMPGDDRREFLSMVEGELKYFVRLVEDLFFIADLDEPRYRTDSLKTELVDLFSDEVRVRQNRKLHDVQWILKAGELTSAKVAGDPHLILRLFKNALDNAGRYARSRVIVDLKGVGNTYVVNIIDDGPGMDATTLASFGQRRANRSRVVHAARGDGPAHLSLGLGSVIMKSIAEVHEGRVDIASSPQGTTVTVTLPRADA